MFGRHATRRQRKRRRHVTSVFELYEEGVKQEITHFSQDKLSLSVILLMDLSASASPVLKEIQSDALLALDRLRERDEVAVMAFSSKTQLVQDFTRDRRLIVKKSAISNSRL